MLSELSALNRLFHCTQLTCFVVAVEVGSDSIRCPCRRINVPMQARRIVLAYCSPNTGTAKCQPQYRYAYHIQRHHQGIKGRGRKKPLVRFKRPLMDEQTMTASCALGAACCAASILQTWNSKRPCNRSGRHSAACFWQFILAVYLSGRTTHQTESAKVSQN